MRFNHFIKSSIQLIWCFPSSWNKSKLKPTSYCMKFNIKNCDVDTFLYMKDWQLLYIVHKIFTTFSCQYLYNTLIAFTSETLVVFALGYAKDD